MPLLPTAPVSTVGTPISFNTRSIRGLPSSASLTVALQPDANDAPGPCVNLGYFDHNSALLTIHSSFSGLSTTYSSAGKKSVSIFVYKDMDCSQNSVKALTPSQIVARGTVYLMVSPAATRCMCMPRAGGHAGCHQFQTGWLTLSRPKHSGCIFAPRRCTKMLPHLPQARAWQPRTPPSRLPPPSCRPQACCPPTPTHIHWMWGMGRLPAHVQHWAPPAA